MVFMVIFANTLLIVYMNGSRKTFFEKRSRNSQNTSSTQFTVESTSIPTTTAKPKIVNYAYPLNIDFVQLFEEEKAQNRVLPIRPINPHNFTYIANPLNICKSKSHREENGVFVLILIKSARKNIHLRQYIRLSKRNENFQKWKERVRIVFLLGYSFTESNVAISKESAVFGDIVQEDFEDTYRNITFKTIMGYNWAISYCSRATHILYQDDDFHFNVDNLFKFLTHHKDPESVFIGLYVKDAPPERRKTHKSYVSFKDYPHSTFPPYFPGGAYVVSSNIAGNLTRTFPYVKHLVVDDVYIGIVAQKLNITLEHSRLLDFRNCANYSQIIACRGYSNKKEIFDGWMNLVREMDFSVNLH
ncbi:beta-1,3-galactosyltransferase 1-like [Saccostrea echinata]|uniref:beta-1,3-galactosyltransferase 1-like n=1 Tax=Saccostrea echinata TaxID=191078 RepID=UPI002A804AEC|nr:beta-1,3-galactosyltransferase 1-like [Saccostrea echinata]